MRIRVPAGREVPLYSNFAVIDHTRDEFIFNHSLSEGSGEDAVATLVAKVVMNPSNAQRLCKTLTEALRQYEKNHGPVKH